ncbi:phosphatase PAP2 family protein [Ammoniphilus sp. 3BR4]|uniref:phosphatase PAP2 family protein n=1 Tax=Ammoniphilus sp. 3BR4 TaxID=3158265 RepID=UPI003467D208
MFESIYMIMITMALTVLIVLWYVLQRNPLVSVMEFVKAIFTKKILIWHFLALLVVLVLNKIQQIIEKEMKGVGDFTPWVYGIEGNIVLYIQHFFQNDVLTYVLTYFYIIVFTALMFVSFIVYHAYQEDKSFYALFYGIMINYLIAIPFYLFFPVNEVWYYQSRVEFLIPQVYPNFEHEYRVLSGLNNCFPSLHTSLSVTMAFIALRSGIPRMGMLFISCAGIIVFSIFYLGIHWVLDMMAGVGLGLMAAAFALRLSESYAPLLNIKSRRTI